MTEPGQFSFRHAARRGASSSPSTAGNASKMHWTIYSVTFLFLHAPRRSSELLGREMTPRGRGHRRRVDLIFTRSASKDSPSEPQKSCNPRSRASASLSHIVAVALSDIVHSVGCSLLHLHN